MSKYSKNKITYEKDYPKRVFEVIHERTHTKEECDYISMKKILSEDRIDYQNYRFGYCINIILEEDDSIEKAFERGYLPYTGNAKNTEEIYYLARSVRINLSRYVRLSENKRVIKKIKSSLNISVDEHNK